jgi:hypothetical protein
VDFLDGRGGVCSFCVLCAQVVAIVVGSVFRAFPRSFVGDWGFQISEALRVRTVRVLVSVPHYDRQRGSA